MAHQFHPQTPACSGSNVTHVFVLRPLGPTSHNEPIQTYPSYVEYVPTVDGDSVVSLRRARFVYLVRLLS